VGALSAPGYETRRADYLKVEWHTHRWAYLHPLQDVQAATLEIKSGLQSRTGAAAERGLAAEEIDRQNAEDKKRAEGRGLRYETHEAKAAALAPRTAPEDDNAPPSE
jgi:capsid protein